jgi:hypothetical protein
MKQLTLSILSLFIMANAAYSQQTPEFQFTLYVMDYYGNMDSVVIGYDSTASSYDTIDTQFGEVDITNIPFDSVFEMRVSPESDNFGNTTPHQFLQRKKEIVKWTCHEKGYPTLQTVYISIRSNNLPLRLEWDKDKFQDTCNGAFVFSEFYQWGLIWNWYPPNMPHHDLKDDGYHIFYNNMISGAPYSIYEAPIEGGGVDTVYSLVLFIGKYNVIKVSTSNIETELTAKVFPNPVLETMQLSIPTGFAQAKTLRIFNVNGQEVANLPVQNYDMVLSVSEYPKGLYFYAIENDKGKLIRGKFMKM